MAEKISMLLSVLLVLMMTAGIALAAGGGEKASGQLGEEHKITGRINSMNQLVNDEGQIFEIANTDKGQELVSQAGEEVQVEVKGTVTESPEGMKVIDVSSYEILEE